MGCQLSKRARRAHTYQVTEASDTLAEKQKSAKEKTDSPKVTMYMFVLLAIKVLHCHSGTITICNGFTAALQLSLVLQITGKSSAGAHAVTLSSVQAGPAVANAGGTPAAAKAKAKLDPKDFMFVELTVQTQVKMPGCASLKKHSTQFGHSSCCSTGL